MTMQTMILGTAFIMLVVNLTFSTKDENENRVRTEANKIYETAGVEIGKSVTDRANSFYNMSMVESGFESSIDKYLIADNKDYKAKESLEVFNNTVKSFGSNVKIMAYQMMLRLSVLSEWVLTLIVLWAGCVLDGYYKRKISQYEYGTASAGLTRLWWTAISFSSLVVIAYVLLPFSLGRLIFYVPLAVVLLVSLGSRYILTSLHKSF